MRYKGFIDTPGARRPEDITRAISREDYIKKLESDLLDLETALDRQRQRTDKWRLRVVQVILVVAIGIVVALHDNGLLAAERPVGQGAPGWSKVSDQALVPIPPVDGPSVAKPGQYAGQATYTAAQVREIRAQHLYFRIKADSEFVRGMGAGIVICFAGWVIGVFAFHYLNHKEN
jgi:hypothetical protein